MSGLFKKKTKTDTTTHQTVAANNNPLLDSGVDHLNSRIMGLSNYDPYSFVANANPLQQQAQTAASGRIGAANPIYDAATAGLAGIARSPAPTMTAAGVDPTSTYQGQTAYADIGNYMDPYKQQVIDATAGDINHQAMIADQQAKSQATGAGAWSGDGAQVLRGITGANYSRDLASTIAGLRSRGFETALGASQQDAQRRQDAMGANAGAANQRAALDAQIRQQTGVANLGSQNDALSRALAAYQAQGQIGQAYDNGQRQDIGLLGELGQSQYAIDQARAMAPISVLGTQTSLFDSLPFNLQRGETTDGTQHSTQTVSDPMGSISGLLGGLGSLAMGVGGLGGLSGLFGGAAGAAGASGVGGLTASNLASRIGALGA